MQYLLATSPWYGVILWIILYISDYYLTIYSARGFREIGHFQFEGSMELTPQFQNDVNNLRPVSKRHLLYILECSSCWKSPSICVTFGILPSFVKFGGTAVWRGRYFTGNGSRTEIRRMNFTSLLRSS